MTTSRRSFLAAGSTLFLAACTKAGRAVQGNSRTTTTTSTSTTASRSTTTTAGGLAAPSDAGSGPARFVKSGPTTSSSVALTFHGSGDLGLLQALLDEAKKASAPITIFAVGNWLDKTPSLAKTILSGGHELANHTYTHPTLTKLDRPAVAKEITGCRDALRNHAGSAGRWFRPSGTPEPNALILAEAGAAGYRTVVGYDIDPLDYQDPGSAAVVRAVEAALHPGAIVSLHTGHSGTVTAFAPIVQAIRAKGLHPVLVRDLLGSQY